MTSAGFEAVCAGLANSRIVEFPLGPQVVSLIGAIDVIENQSRFTIEREAVARSVEKRRIEYFSGRNLARRAMKLLGVKSAPIGSNQDRTPQWPSGLTGSISHNDDYVMVALTTSSEISAIGIDLESVNSVDANLRTIVRNKADAESFDDTALFCAKESVYKAVYPVCREFLEFSDVSIVAGNRHGEYFAYGDTGLTSSNHINKGSGQFFFVGKLVVAAFLVPNLKYNTEQEE